MNSSIDLGLLPAASMTVGLQILGRHPCILNRRAGLTKATPLIAHCPRLFTRSARNRQVVTAQRRKVAALLSPQLQSEAGTQFDLHEAILPVTTRSGDAPGESDLAPEGAAQFSASSTHHRRARSSSRSSTLAAGRNLPFAALPKEPLRSSA